MIRFQEIKLLMQVLLFSINNSSSKMSKPLLSTQKQIMQLIINSTMELKEALEGKTTIHRVLHITTNNSNSSSNKPITTKEKDQRRERRIHTRLTMNTINSITSSTTTIQQFSSNTKANKQLSKHQDRTCRRISTSSQKSSPKTKTMVITEKKKCSNEACKIKASEGKSK